MDTDPATVSLGTPAQRAACTALADALDREMRKLPRNAPFYVTGPFKSAIGQLRQMAEFGNGGCTLSYTSHPVVVRLATEHNVPIAGVKPQANAEARARLLRGCDLMESIRPHLRK